MKRVAITLVFSVLLTGCALFTSPVEFPVYEQHAQDRVNTFSMIPSRRMVIVKSDDPSNHNEKKLIICAEASADVSDNLMSSLAGSLAVAGPTSATGEKSADAAIAASKALETTAQFLFKRTQGIQLYRDGMYYLCQARMNGFMENDEYRRRTQDLLEKVLPLIHDELPLLENTFPSQASGNPRSDGSPEVSAGAGRAAASTSQNRVDARIAPGEEEAAGNNDANETPPSPPPFREP